MYQECAECRALTLHSRTCSLRGAPREDGEYPLLVTSLDCLKMLQECRSLTPYGNPVYALLTNVIDTVIGVWPPASVDRLSAWQLAMAHLARAKHWRDAFGGWRERDEGM